MSKETLEALRELLAQLAEDLTTYDNTLNRLQSVAHINLMLTVRRIDQFNTDTFGG